MLNLTANSRRQLTHVPNVIWVCGLLTSVCLKAHWALRTLTGFAVGRQAITRRTGALVAAQGVPALVLTRVSGFALIDVCGKKHGRLRTI